MCTSWCRLPWYKADFGWGKPSWFATKVATQFPPCRAIKQFPNCPISTQEQESPVRLRLDYYTALGLTSCEGHPLERLDQSGGLYPWYAINTLPAGVTAVEEGFISTNARQIIVSAPTTTELVEKLEEYVPCHERVASKLNWETEQQLGYPQAQEIGR
ncbi:putative ethylene-insensitive protein 2-like [Capsicum annuum]|nr:putative ethylene-insensitive protein 2-like [Capsicum annuum]